MSERGRPLRPGEQKFFENFFVRLDAAGVAWLVLRNYEDFPARIGHDLDVFFRRVDLAKAVDLFRAALEHSGGEVLHVHERDYVLAVWFRAAPDEPQTIHLDFYHGAFTWHGHSYLSDAELISGSRRWGEYRVPRPAHEALNLFLMSMLWGAFYKFRYHSRIHQLLENSTEKAEFCGILATRFGLAGQLPINFSRELEPPRAEMKSLARKLRRQLRARDFAACVG